MKSKAEILKAVDTCIFLDGSCCDCPYFDELDYRNQISKYLHALLNKSDFEVLSEIISRTKRFDFECHEGPKGLMLIKLQNPAARDCLPVNIRFDKEGNII